MTKAESEDTGKPGPYQRASDEIEGRKPAPPPDSPPGDTPPAGPHAAPELTNDAATPGAGALPEADDAADVEPGTG